MSNLHHKAAEALDFIREFRLEHGTCPTYGEIAHGIGFSPKSKGRIGQIVDHLERTGRIRRLPGRSRSIELIPASPVIAVELPPHLYANVQDLARKAKVTPAAVIIEAVRDGFTAFRSRTVPKTVDCETSNSPGSVEGRA